MAPVCNPSAQEAKAGRWGVQTQSELHSEKSQTKQAFQNCHVYIIDQSITMHIQGMGEWHLLALSFSLCNRKGDLLHVFNMYAYENHFLKIGSHVAQDDLDLTV